MTQHITLRKGGIESIDSMDSHYCDVCFQKDITYCRSLVKTAMDFLVDMKNQDRGVAGRRDMAIECLDSALDKLHRMEGERL